jgi:hypothetical protein
MLMASVRAGLSAESTRRNALVVLGWLTRGLAMRVHHSVQDCLRQVRRAGA